MMLKDRVDELEDLVHELEGRALMHEVFIAQLLGRAGMASGNMELFVNGVLTLVGNDLETNALQAKDRDAAVRFTRALEAFAEFADVMQKALKRPNPESLN